MLSHIHEKNYHLLMAYTHGQTLGVKLKSKDDDINRAADTPKSQYSRFESFGNRLLMGVIA